jgi:mRNA-degrading endonuclease toxin of MazEF toxin-antitoxin module
MPRSRPEPGAIVMVTWAATDGGRPKRRPAVVVSWDGFHNQRGALVALPVSSWPVRDGFELALPRWREVGLRRPSKVRLGQFVLLDGDGDYPVLGRLSPSDLERLRHGIAAVFA